MNRAELGVLRARGSSSPAQAARACRGARPSAALRSGPRPASALPNSNRFSWIARRVGSSKVLSTSSISTGSGWAALQRDHRALRIALVEVPRSISRYLRPSAERARTITVESSGSGSTSASSFRSSCAALSCRRRRHRLDRLDLADADAADRGPRCRGTSWAAFGDLRREPVGGHERQARVRVVGEEDGEDDDHHGQRADHRRARGDAGDRRGASSLAPIRPVTIGRPIGPCGRAGRRVGALLAESRRGRDAVGCGLGGRPRAPAAGPRRASAV